MTSAPATLIEVSEVRRKFVARIEGVDLHAPLDELTVERLRNLLDEYSVIVFCNPTPLQVSEQVALATHFGPVMTAHRKWRVIEPARSCHSGALEISNLGVNGDILATEHRRLRLRALDEHWHSDISFHPNRAVYSLLSALDVPPCGGHTDFADMRRAYDSITAAERDSLERFSVVHSLAHSRAIAGIPDGIDGPLSGNSEATHWLVQVNKGNGSAALYLGAHAARIEQLSQEEGRALIERLTEVATDPEGVYRHIWKRGDLVVWNNLSTMHRATPFNAELYKRDMRRVVVRDWDDSLPRAVIDELAAARNARPPHLRF